MSYNEIMRPCPTEVNKYLRKWKQSQELEKYRQQEKALDKLFLDLCPKNTDIDDILIKVSVLNDFYSTNIFSVYPVAEKIQSLNIDERLDYGDLSLVADIAAVAINGIEKNFYSFATKYCSHHKPEKYATYDYYVDKMLRHFRNEDRFAEFKNDDLKDYQKFIGILNKFKEYYELQVYNWKRLDKYLWQLGRDRFPRDYKNK